jgi:single-strand DNA-binding protein
MNSINLTGNICNDLEVKSTQSGKSVLSFNLAVKRPFTKDTTDFIPVVVWDQGAEYLGKYGRKGSRVAVSGKLTTGTEEITEVAVILGVYKDDEMLSLTETTVALSDGDFTISSEAVPEGAEAVIYFWSTRADMISVIPPQLVQ